jgi:hypothetical protein
MSRKSKVEDYKYIKAETIRKACGGDGEALGTVILRYENYGRKCLRNIAATKYNLDIKSLPMDDLMQYVWMRLIRVIVRKFKV